MSKIKIKLATCHVGIITRETVLFILKKLNSYGNDTVSSHTPCGRFTRPSVPYTHDDRVVPITYGDRICSFFLFLFELFQQLHHNRKKAEINNETKRLKKENPFLTSPRHIDTSVLAFSLSFHRHPLMCIPFTSRFMCCS